MYSYEVIVKNRKCEKMTSLYIRAIKVKSSSPLPQSYIPTSKAEMDIVLARQASEPEFRFSSTHGNARGSVVHL